MTRCPNCRTRYREPRGEEGTHGCPRCGVEAGRWDAGDPCELGLCMKCRSPITAEKEIESGLCPSCACIGCGKHYRAPRRKLCRRCIREIEDWEAVRRFKQAKRVERMVGKYGKFIGTPDEFRFPGKDGDA